MDTGYILTDSISGNQATRSNSGSAITLKSIEIGFQIGENIDTSPVINADSAGIPSAKLNLGSINSSKITITGLANRKVSGDMDLIGYLRTLIKTIGIKLLYYSSGTDGYRDITDTLGDTDVTHNGSGKLLSVGIPHIHVLCSGFTVRQTSISNILRYTLECVESA